MAKTLASTPRADGFYMPAEFETHEACWLLWPERTDVWRAGAKPAQRVFAKVAGAIAACEAVTVGVSAAQFRHARTVLPENIRVVELSADDAWIRDCGPTFLRNREGEIRGVDWQFNAWGGLREGAYFPWDRDELVARKVLEIAGLPRYEAPLVLEGGSIHSDGQGTLLTTESCLLNENRNSHLQRAQIEAHLRDYLGAERVIWLPAGLSGDETDGHVDNLACFLAPGQVALAWEKDEKTANGAITRAAAELLSRERDARGRSLQIHLIPLPPTQRMTAREAAGIDRVSHARPRPTGQELAASYVNFYFANGACIVPTFAVEQDESVLRQLAEICPGRRIVDIPSREILLGGGNIHCITQQQPAARREVAATRSEEVGTS